MPHPDPLFSDRWRGPKLALGCGLLLALCAWHGHVAASLPFGWHKVASDPQQHDGAELVMPLYRVTAVEGPGRFRLGKVALDVPIADGPEGLAIGDTVSVRGRFSAQDGRVHASEWEVHHWRKAKFVLGLLGVVVALFGLPLAFRWRQGRVVERG